MGSLSSLMRGRNHREDLFEQASSSSLPSDIRRPCQKKRSFSPHIRKVRVLYVFNNVAWPGEDFIEMALERKRFPSLFCMKPVPYSLRKAALVLDQCLISADTLGSSIRISTQRKRIVAPHHFHQLAHRNHWNLYRPRKLVSFLGLPFTGALPLLTALALQSVKELVSFTY